MLHGTAFTLLWIVVSLVLWLVPWGRPTATGYHRWPHVNEFGRLALLAGLIHLVYLLQAWVHVGS